MKNKSWIIILIMGIALTISIGYSIWLSQKDNKSTATTTSIIQMSATTATIKNTLAGTGTIEYKEKIEGNIDQNTIVEGTTNTEVPADQTQPADPVKTYQITLTIEDKDLSKAQVGQDAEILIKQGEESLNYLGKVIKIDKQTVTKSTITVEVTNPDDKLLEGMTAFCTLIVEEAKDVVALPIEAIQKNEEGKEFVDVLEQDGSTKQVLIETGLSDEYYIEITSGLNVGDRVQIIKSVTTVQDGNTSPIKNLENNINKN